MCMRVCNARFVYSVPNLPLPLLLLHAHTHTHRQHMCAALQEKAIIPWHLNEKWKSPKPNLPKPLATNPPNPSTFAFVVAASAGDFNGHKCRISRHYEPRAGPHSSVSMGLMSKCWLAVREYPRPLRSLHSTHSNPFRSEN